VNHAIVRAAISTMHKIRKTDKQLEGIQTPVST